MVMRYSSFSPLPNELHATPYPLAFPLNMILIRIPVNPGFAFAGTFSRIDPVAWFVVICFHSPASYKPLLFQSTHTDATPGEAIVIDNEYDPNC